MTADWRLTEVLNPKQSAEDLAGCKSLLRLPEKTNSLAACRPQHEKQEMQLVLSAVQFINSAVAATTSSYTSQCMNDYVPKEADLVLVEFSVNDWEVIDAQTFTWMDNSLRWGVLSLLANL